jgi:glutamyl-tRNA reductase
MHLVLVGTSHHHAPVEVRERLAVGADFVGELASVEETVCLSTCNRTELYVAADDDGGDAVETRASRALTSLAGTEVEPLLYRLHDETAALHLFRVAAGLDSLVPGEGEILGQVRASYEAGRVGPLLDRLFRQALHVGKRVRAETAIGESPTSVPAAAAALAQQVFGELGGRRVLLIGAGKTGEQTARSLLSRGAEIAVVANRSSSRAVDLARRVGGRAAALAQVEEELAAVDVVVSATSSEQIILGREQVAGALGGRRGVPLFLIDIAVPRDLDPAIDELEDCYLYDIDDLQEVVEASLAARRQEGEAAEAIAEQEARKFGSWLSSLDVVPAITQLRARAEEIRRAELARAQGRLGRMSAADRNAVESLTSQIVNKLLHLPTVRMKEAAAGADGAVYADAVRRLFDLDPGVERADDDSAPGQPRQ